MDAATSYAVPRRRFGRTELAIPVFSCGGMRYQQSWKDEDSDKVTEENQANLAACIHRAVELGINHIETARGYGTSEIQLGPVLAEFNRDDLIVQTKVGPRDTGSEFVEVVEQSLSNLRLDHVDLLAVHGVNTDRIIEQIFRPGGTVEALKSLKRDGVCRHIGFSTHGPTEVIAKAAASGVFDYVNLHWYFVFENNWPAILEARKQDMGVFIISPNDKGGKLYEPTDIMQELCAPLTPMQFNDLYCLSRDEVHTLSLGAAKPEDFVEHVEGIAAFGDRPDLVDAAARRIRSHMDMKLGADWVAGWQDGLPRWEDVPGDMNLHEIVRLWNYATALDMESYAKMRYNLLGQGDHWFPGRNAAEFDDKALLTALSGYSFADRIPGILRDAHERFFEAPKKRLSES